MHSGGAWAAEGAPEWDGAAKKKEGKRHMRRAQVILWCFCIRGILKRRFWTVWDMETLSREGIRPILHGGKVAGWEVQRG